MHADEPKPTPNPPAPVDASLDGFFAACYDEVRGIARRILSKENRAHTLQTTDLVHEVYARLKNTQSLAINDQTHFMALAARTVRRHLVDEAKKRRAEKRGGKMIRVTLVTDAVGGYEPFQPELLALGKAMEELERLHPRQAWAIDMRFIAGQTVEQVAKELGVSEKTVKNDTRVALAFLRREVAGRGPEER
ncbi:MAG: ECF-type sigma factor [Candidatus Krumholzibacteria bacterium]|nr:ECF-type sigma factor [Candidatus Krumholzibacteria bacterium]MDH4338659.1 ECF-type sigma factor [Candidatus Krumholzibacteria bacterium]MDH5271424.1 ECF-type sigma factor [Candidatus Krumholzibacteria bacterium]